MRPCHWCTGETRAEVQHRNGPVTTPPPPTPPPPPPVTRSPTPSEDAPMPKPPPAPHRVACARILAELWPRKQVAEALQVSIDTLDKWGVKGTPTPQQRLKEKLLATGASQSEVAQMLGVSRQAVSRADRDR